MRLRNKFLLFSIGFITLSTACISSVSALPLGLISQQISIQNLPELNFDTLGIQTNIPTDIWQHADHDTVQSLINDITKKPLTPAIYHLLVQLMLTDCGDNQKLPFDFRINTLMKLGAWEDVLTLIHLVPEHKQTPHLLSTKVQALLLLNRPQEACSLLEKKPSLAQFADELRLTCAIMLKDKIGADLIFSTHKETGDLDNTTIALWENLASKKTILPNTDFQLKHLPLVAQFPLTDQQKSNLNLADKRALVFLSDTITQTTLELAEKAFVAPTYLGNLYQKLPDNQKHKRATLYKKMLAEENQVLLATHINTYLDSAQKDGLFLHLAPISIPFLDKISPTEKMVDTAFLAIQAYALSQNTAAAHAWFNLLNNSSAEHHKVQALLLAPLLQQMGAGIPKDIATALNECLIHPSQRCASFLSKITIDMPVSTPKTALTPQKLATYTYTPAAGSALKGLLKNKKRAEALLYAIHALQKTTTFEPHIIDVLKQITPHSLTHTIIMEQYVYQ